MTESIGVFGASSMVGQRLLVKLLALDRQIIAFSRYETVIASMRIKYPAVRWLLVDEALPAAVSGLTVNQWIYIAPIWTLAEHRALIKSMGAKRLLVLSSTSRFTKQNSNDATEIAVVEDLIASERSFKTWAEQSNIKWLILYPTLIYDPGKDQNITTIIRFIERFGFFPVVGAATGLRQPIHARDVASACCQLLMAEHLSDVSYTIAGAETMSYRAMVHAVFAQLQRPVRLATLPVWMFRIAINLLRILPRFNKLNSEMAKRMNRDMAFDNTRAISDFGFTPSKFNIKN